MLRRVHFILKQKAALDITSTDGDLSDVKVLQNHALRYCCNVKSYTEVHVRDPHVDTNVQLVDIRWKKTNSDMYLAQYKQGYNNNSYTIERDVL